MPAYRHNVIVEIVYGIKAFLNVEVGLTRSNVLEYGSAEQLPKRIERQLASKDRLIAELRSELARSRPDRSRHINPENITWIFGTARVGSTWLGAMMEDLEDHWVWHEPIVGELFGGFYYVSAKTRRGKHFIMGDRYKEVWLESIRTFVLDGASARFPRVAKKGHLIVKEPNGSIGAPLLVEALPESRMIFLIRDPRDVVASGLDAQRKGGWRFERQNKDGQKELSQADIDPDSFIRGLAERYMRFLGNAKQAYEAHSGPKVLVRYEQLVADTLSVMKHIHSTLGIAVDEKELAKVVEKHSWENIPEEKKGEGKFYRKGTPGSWQEDLTPKQVNIVEKKTAPILKEFYPS